MKSILDPSFRYRSSVHTDLKATFAKVRREQNKRQTGSSERSTAQLNVLRIPSRAQPAE